MKPFSEDDDLILRKMVSRFSNESIAHRLGRTAYQVRVRLEELNIVRTEPMKKHNRTKPPAKDPTPEEFLARVAEVQSRWTPEDWAKRATCRVVAYEVPVVWIGE